MGCWQWTRELWWLNTTPLRAIHLAVRLGIAMALVTLSCSDESEISPTTPPTETPKIEPEPTVTASVEVSASASPHADALPATAIKIFYQQDSAILPREPNPGTCFQSSHFDPGRSDVWRCATWDPCFEIPTDVPGEAELLCVSDPWSGNGTRLEVSVPAHEQYQLSDYSKPWALELANGLRCSFVGGGTSSVDGERLNYGCDPEGAIKWVVGYPDQSSSSWRVRLVEMDQSLITVLGSEDVSVLIAWY
jgi:hypothetical protein